MKQLPFLQDEESYQILEINLKDFPCGEVINSCFGKNGIIDFFDVNKDVKVLAHDSKTNSLKWANVKTFSAHYSRALVIVLLSDGNQIFTDDDPRAIYGFDVTSNTWGTFTPDEAIQKRVKVPSRSNLKSQDITSYSNYIHNYTIDNIEQYSFSELDTAILIKEYFYKIHNICVIIHYDDKTDTYKLSEYVSDIPTNTDDNLVDIVSVTHTHKLEHLYDLTVPGYENFTTTQGVTLSNTMNIHAPATQEAIRDIKEKLLPSKQLFSVRDNRNIVNLPKQEFILGAYAPNKRKSEKKFIFKSVNEMMTAFSNGDIKLSDEFEIIT